MTDKPAEKKADDSLKQSAQDNSVILVGDADFLADGVAVDRVQTLFGAALVQRNGNLPFAQNALEQLTGDSNLIAVRSRATLDYPLTKIQEMEAEAVKASQSEINQTGNKVPAILLTPIAVTTQNMKATVIADKFVALTALCAGDVKSACNKHGI